ncbi:MAG: amidohydrolase family protein, partial [Paraburkholderia nemoris]
MRIDAHQHYWDPARGDYEWLTPELKILYRLFGPDDLKPLREAAGVERTVVVQAAPTIDETRYLLDIARHEPSIAGVVGWVPLLLPTAPAVIGALAHEPKFKGVRPMLQDLPDDTWIANPDLAPAIEALIEHDLAFDALIYARHVEPFETFAERF